MVYAFGAYGTNNLGDDAIFLGLQQTLPKDRVVQVYINRPSVMDSICYATITKDTFTKKDHLVIGGGGLLHCKHAVEDYTRIAVLAKDSGAKVHIRRIGAEGIKAEFSENVKILFSLADNISVRSIKSIQMLNDFNIPTKNIQLAKDYAYEVNFKKRTKVTTLKEMFAHSELPLIGLVTAGNGGGVDTISWIVSQLLLDGINCNIVHIPHSRAYVSCTNNDVVTGELLWSSMSIYHAKRLERYIPLSMPENPFQLYDIYTQVDGIIGMRYHSFIFSKITNRPLLGIVHGVKAQAFFDEEKYGSYIASSSTKEELLEKCKDFITKIKSHGK